MANDTSYIPGPCEIGERVRDLLEEVELADH
jgi:hypothetical protein